MSNETSEPLPHWTIHKRRDWSGSVAFFGVHLAAFGALWSGITWQAVVAGVVLFWVRQWGVTAGYHRYFSHRTFKTSRVFQFLLAFLAQSSVQKGALWWAAHHRRHHKNSDQEGDLHSPKRDGFWYAHIGWLFVEGADETDYARIKDFTKYPELVWLNEYHLVPPIILGLGLTWWLGLPGLFVGFVWSTILLWHNTFFINSLAHVWGRRRFETTDTSKNNALLALMTLGEGWHNNHHRYQSSARNGFYWWEVDVTYYVLKLLSWAGIVWDLRPVPERVLAEGRRADRARQERSATEAGDARPSVVPPMDVAA